MRPAFRVAAPYVVIALAACGESAAARLERETLAVAAPAVDAFAADLDAGRIDAALGRTTRAFQASAPAASVRGVLGEMVRALGASKARTPRGVESLVAEGDPAVVREAVLLLDGKFERGTAAIRARVHRDAARGGWQVDGYEVRSDLFTWTLRK